MGNAVVVISHTWARSNSRLNTELHGKAGGPLHLSSWVTASEVQEFHGTWNGPYLGSLKGLHSAWSCMSNLVALCILFGVFWARKCKNAMANNGPSCSWNEPYLGSLERTSQFGAACQIWWPCAFRLVSYRTRSARILWRIMGRAAVRMSHTWVHWKGLLDPELLVKCGGPVHLSW